ncbi:MAG: hypothetical protein ACTSRR_05470 [Candidatus Heimdallarchaeaceae archaeon]
MERKIKEEVEEFLNLEPKEQISIVQNQCEEVISQIKEKNVDLEHFIYQVTKFKTFFSLLSKVRRIYRKEYFDLVVNTLAKLWYAVEKCQSQKLLYPTLSAFTEVFSKLKGLNPYFTLEACINKTISYSLLPSIAELEILLSKEKQHLQFLLDYFQLESVLKLVEKEEEKITIIQSATNYIQTLILTLYNFLFTIPNLKKKDFISWYKLFEEALSKAISTHKLLLKQELSEINKFRTLLSKSSLHSIKAQLLLLWIKFLNEKNEEKLNLALMENTQAMQTIEHLLDNSIYKENVKPYYFQYKTLFLETRFYQLLHNFVKSQFRNDFRVGDIKDDKKSLSLKNLKFQVDEILNEIWEYISEIQTKGDDSIIGVSSNMINTYAKVSYGAYIYEIRENIEQMEQIIKTRRLDISDPELSLMLGHYWLMKWGENSENNRKYLELAESYFTRAAEIYQILFNNKKLPIYAFSISGLISLRQNNPPKAEVFFMKADDVFNDAKYAEILNESEIFYYTKFREQIDRILNNGRIKQPLRFNKPFNPLDFNTWTIEKKDWRKKYSYIPEPFPFHLTQLKIHEFEFMSPRKENEE